MEVERCESECAIRVDLETLKESLADTQPVGHVVSCCKTLDQVRRYYVWQLYCMVKAIQ